jgi:hypothetical protein
MPSPRRNPTFRFGGADGTGATGGLCGADDAALGAPQDGHAVASEEISFPHSWHFMSAKVPLPQSKFRAAR